MKKFKIEIEVLRQKVYTTVEAVNKTTAQAIAYDRIKKCKKEITDVLELWKIVETANMEPSPMP